MKVNLKLARVGMNMEEATIANWQVAPGQSFAAGDVLYAIETDKVTHDVEATADGTMLEILVPEGEAAAVGDVICVVDVELAS